MMDEGMAVFGDISVLCDNFCQFRKSRNFICILTSYPENSNQVTSASSSMNGTKIRAGIRRWERDKDDAEVEQDGLNNR